MARFIRAEARSSDDGSLLKGAKFTFYLDGQKLAETTGGDGFATIEIRGTANDISVQARYKGKTRKVKVAGGVDIVPITFSLGPPEPPPVLDAEDPQKGRWGGKSELSGRKLLAVLSDARRASFYFNLIVQSTDGTPLVPPIRFHLHDTYDKHIQDITRIRGGTWATWEGIMANEAYVVGMQVQDGKGNWLGLEYDLNELPKLPKKLKDPDWVAQQRIKRREEQGKTQKQLPANEGNTSERDRVRSHAVAAPVHPEADYEAIVRALTSAFVDGDALNRFIQYRFGREPLNDVSSAKAHSDRVLDFVNWFESRGQLADLIDRAVASRPGNPLLALLASTYISTAWSAADGSGALDPRLERFVNERIVRKGGLYRDIGAFLGGLQELIPCVCCIRYLNRDGNLDGGTGFLIAGDRVLTNYHVIEPLCRGVAEPADVEVLFDYRTRRAGGRVRLVNETRVGLDAGSWLQAHSAFARADSRKLDYAVLKLERPIGDEPVGHSPEPGSAKRGWLEMPTRARSVTREQDVLILQHPDGQPLKLAFGRITDIVGNALRVRYDANTEGGSSGSPVLSTRLELIALHQAGDPNFKRLIGGVNQGIPIGQIIADLT